MCTSVACGKQAVADGITIIARNEDYKVNNWNKYLKYRSEPQYASIKTGDWILGNGLKVPIPKKSYQYCSIPDALGSKEATCTIGDSYYFEERGINECNVAISATNSMDVNDKTKEYDPLVTVGIEEAIITTLILPQVESASEAVELLGSYVETYGASEGDGILFSDETEVWYFEIGSAHHWIAVKVPEDSYLVVANCMRVHGVDLEDGENVKHSSGLFEFVCKNQLLENPQKNHFDFANAFGYSGSMITEKEETFYDPYYNVDRIWLAQKILSPSLIQKTRIEEYPLFLKPDKRITLQDLMTVFRAGYKNTELEGIATRPIGVVRTTESHIISIDPDMPNNLKGVIWQSISSPLGSVYMPLFFVADEIPKCYETGFSQYDPQSAYWSFRGLYALSSVNQNCYMPLVQKLWADFENEFIKEHNYIKNMIKDLAEEDYNRAVAFAQNYSIGILCQMVDVANLKLSDCMTEISVEQKDVLRI